MKNYKEIQVYINTIDIFPPKNTISYKNKKTLVYNFMLLSCILSYFYFLKNFYSSFV